VITRRCETCRSPEYRFQCDNLKGHKWTRLGRTTSLQIMFHEQLLHTACMDALASRHSCRPILAKNAIAITAFVVQTKSTNGRPLKLSPNLGELRGRLGSGEAEQILGPRRRDHGGRHAARLHPSPWRPGIRAGSPSSRCSPGQRLVTSLQHVHAIWFSSAERLGR